MSDPVAPRGRRAIGVNQQPGGTYYPLIWPPQGFDQLFADLYFQYPDEALEFEPPLRIAWIYGFGSDPSVDCSEIVYPTDGPGSLAEIGSTVVLGSPPVLPVHAYEMEIRDSNGVVLFRTVDADSYQETDWDNRLKIIEWSLEAWVLRVAIHTAFSPNQEPREFPLYASFDPAIPLDDRSSVRLARRLEAFVSGLEVLDGRPVLFQSGFNTSLSPQTPVPLDGAALSNTLTVNFTPGAGAGLHPSDCGDALTLRTISHIRGDDGGRFRLIGGDCARVERPVFTVVTEEMSDAARQISLLANQLKITDDCSACSSCDDFIAVYNALRRLRNRTADLFDRAHAARDEYVLARKRFLSQKTCRESQYLRIVADPFCPCLVGYAVGFCNQTEECLENVILAISFVYSDAEGVGIPAASNPTNVAILPNTTFRGGFVDLDNHRSVTREAYHLSGSWPNYFAYFPFVNPKQKPYVTWYMQYLDCQASDLIEIVADAYTVPGETEIPDYVAGEGPVGPAAYDARLVPLPVKVAVGLLPTCEAE